MKNKQEIGNRKQNFKRGFTLLETLFAIFILVLSITGPMVFAQSGLRASFQARDQITAFYLAQDVIETIKNMRDDNGLDGDPWLQGLVGVGLCSGNNPCQIDTVPESPVVSQCQAGGCPPLRTSEGNAEYSYSGDDDSRFTRTVYINTISNDEAEVVVEVEWVSPVTVGRHRIVVQENIYDWIPGVD